MNPIATPPVFADQLLENIFIIFSLIFSRNVFGVTCSFLFILNSVIPDLDSI